VFDNSTRAERAVGVQWQYQHGGWQPYAQQASDVVEAAYQDWLANPNVDVRAIRSGAWEYEVDFNAMTQTNIQHEAHTQRSIRRAQV